MDFIKDLIRIPLRVLMAMTLAYWSGTLFDAQFATQITPFFTFALPIILVTDLNKVNTIFFEVFYDIFILPLTILMYTALLSSTLFTSIQAPVLEMLGYEGSIYMVAFIAGILIILLRAIYTVAELVEDANFG